MEKLRIVTLFLVSFVLVALSVVVVNAKVYQTDNLKVVYDNPSDLKLAIPAVDKARKFFEKLGYKADYQVNLVFKEAVYLDIPLLGEGGRIIKERVYGVYYGNFSEDLKNVIYVSSWGTDYLHKGSRKCFEIPVTLELHSTIVTHETAHLLLRELAGKLGHGVNEYIAYTTQIATMSESLRNQVLSKYEDCDIFESELMINGMYHAHGPHQFGVISYKHFKKTGPEMFNRIISGKFDPDDMMNAIFGVTVK